MHYFDIKYCCALSSSGMKVPGILMKHTKDLLLQTLLALVTGKLTITADG